MKIWQLSQWSSYIDINFVVELSVFFTDISLVSHIFCTEAFILWYQILHFVPIRNKGIRNIEKLWKTEISGIRI